MGEDERVRLVRHEEIHVVDREALRREHAADHRRHFTQRERKDLGAVHVNVVGGALIPAVVDLHGGVRIVRLSHAACGNNEVRRAAPIGSVHERAGQPSARGGRVARQQRGRRAVGEHAPNALVARVEVLAVRVRCKKQHAVRLLGFDQALGQTEAVHVARASEIDVDRTAVPLDHAGSGRQKVVRRLRAVDHVVDVGGRCAARRE